MSKMESLLADRGNRATDRWYPQPIVRYCYAINLNNTVPNTDELRKNLAYSLQYIEYLELQIKELHLSSVLYIMLVKTYVITGMSILEGLFSNLLKSNGLWKQSDLESLGQTTSSESTFGNDKYIIKTEILKKVNSYDITMTLDEMINKLIHHHEILNINHLIYPIIKRLRSMRNRIHLQMINGRNDHDYNAFDFMVKKEMQTILYNILTSPKITNNPQLFEFLNPST